MFAGMTPFDSANRKRVLVLGDYRQTVVVVRSLSRAGYAVTLGTSNADSSTALSSHVSAVWHYQRETSEHFCAQLDAYLRKARPDVVFVVGESQLRDLLPVAARIEALSTWALPKWETIERCLDKNSMYMLTRHLGIPTLPWSKSTDINNWRKLASDMGFPVVVKPGDSSTQVCGRKALIFHTPEAMDTFLARHAGEFGSRSLLLQKFASGVRHNCHVGAAAGKLVAYFEQTVTRTDELDCTGIGIEGTSVAPSATLRAYCKSLLESLGYNGIGCIQFLVDKRSGGVEFLEFNPRMDSTTSLPYKLGYDFPKLAIELVRHDVRWSGAQIGERAVAADVALLSASYPYGEHYHWLYGDLLSWHNALRNRHRTVGQLGLWALRSFWVALISHHLTWDVRDPLPTLYVFWRKLLHAIHLRRAIA